MTPLKSLLAQACIGLCTVAGISAARGQVVLPPSPPAVAGDNAAPLRRAWQRALASGVRDVPACKADAAAVDGQARPLIVLDLGHGYTPDPKRPQLGTASAPLPGLKDHGTVSRRTHLWETDIIDALGAELRDLLVGRGYDVSLTREPGEVFLGSANRFTTLASRGYYAAYASEETGRPVILLSLHVDPGEGGHRIYVQNSQYGVAGAASQALAREIADDYTLGAARTLVNAKRWNNRMLHSFAAAESVCDGVRGAAALLELGDINDGRDIAQFRALMHDPKPVALQIADGLERYVDATAPAPSTLTAVAGLPRGLDRLLLAQQHRRHGHRGGGRHHGILAG